MNKKGFTLIELLASISIMTLIATITSVNIIKILSEKQESTEKNKDSIIETATCVYIELKENNNLKDICLTNGCTISTKELIESGLLSEEDFPQEKYINIYEYNNEKICKVKGD